MSKTCFVIMPISDVEPYQTGHFKLVYEHLIKPACIKAGFTPIRADEIQETDYIILSIIEHILNADVAICDLSAKNPNVLYELGLRQAFDKPVTLIKDTITPRIFDVLGYRDIQYDESLRIDSVSPTIDSIAKTLINDYEKGSNSLSKMLGIKVPKKTEMVVISEETELLLNSFNTLNDKISSIEVSLSKTPDIRLLNENLYLRASNKYHVIIDLSTIADTEDETYIYNYSENTTVRFFLDEVFSQIEPYGIKAFTYGFDWFIYNESTKSDIQVINIENLIKFKPFNDNRSLLAAGIYPFNRLTIKLTKFSFAYTSKIV